jgi:hypothetical protein
MRNFLAIYAVDGFDSSLSYVVKIGSTPQEAQDQWDAFQACDPGATLENPPTRFFWMMNKNILVAYAAQHPLTLDPFHASQFTQDEKVARDFGIDSDLWQGTDVNDPAQIKAAKIAKSVTKAGSKQDLSGAQTLVETFLSLMQSLITSFQSKGDRRTVGILKDLLNRFLSGSESITDILDELRKLFII